MNENNNENANMNSSKNSEKIPFLNVSSDTDKKSNTMTRKDLESDVAEIESGVVPGSAVRRERERWKMNAEDKINRNKNEEKNITSEKSNDTNSRSPPTTDYVTAKNNTSSVAEKRESGVVVGSALREQREQWKQRKQRKQLHQDTSAEPENQVQRKQAEEIASRGIAVLDEEGGHATSAGPGPGKAVVAHAVTTNDLITKDDLAEAVRNQIMSQMVMAEQIDVEVPSNHHREIGVYTIEKPISEEGNRKSSRRTIYLLLFVLILIAVIVGVVMGLQGRTAVGGGGGGGTEPPSVVDVVDSSTGGDVVEEAVVLPPVEVTPLELDRLRDFLSDEITRLFGEYGRETTDAVRSELREAWNNEGSPEQKALVWLIRNGLSIDIQTDIKEKRDIARQMYYMVSLYYSTNGENWTHNDGWLDPNVPVCEWYPGRLCTYNERRQLNNHNAIRGQTRSLRVFQQDNDSELYWTGFEVEQILLSSNNLDGTLPIGLALMKELEIIDFDDNPKLTGRFPMTFGFEGLRKLDVFRASRTSFTGTFYSPFRQGRGLEQLVEFSMEDSQGMDGASFPFELWSAPNMRLLNLRNMNLSGSLPAGRESPEEAYLAGNQLSGRLPLSDLVVTWEKLRTLDLRNNDLSGEIPDQLATNFNNSLTTLRLEGNPRLTGSVSSAVCDAFLDGDEDNGDGTFSADCLVPESTLDCSCCTRCCINGERCQLM